LLSGRSRSAGPSSPILPQYQLEETLLVDLPPLRESSSNHHTGRASAPARPREPPQLQLPEEDIYGATPDRERSVVASSNQQSARQWHRSILQRAHTAQSNGVQISWANVVPLSLLGRWAAVVECPICKELTRTSVRHKAGKGTQ
jgi:hypothetical protein